MKQNKVRSTNKKYSVLAITFLGVAVSFVFVFSALASTLSSDAIVSLANKARSEASLPPLVENAKLSQAAKNKANDMLKNDYFAHTSPKGVEPWYWMKQAGYSYKAAGENLAINYTDAEEQHEAWMKSETHRANILNTRYQEIGIAVVRGKINGKESTVTVEFFGTPLQGMVTSKESATAPALPAPLGVQIEVPEIVVPEIPVVLVPASLPESVLQREQQLPLVEPRVGVEPLVPVQVLRIVFLALFGLSALLGPVVIIGRAGQVIRTTISLKSLKQKKENVPEGQKRNTKDSVTKGIKELKSIPVMGSLNIDSIHHRQVGAH